MNEEWTRISNEWTEADSGIRHYILINTATGVGTGCIVGRNGHFLAHFSIGKTYPDVTIIDGPEVWPSTVINTRVPVAKSKTYALGRGNEIEPSITYADLMKQVQIGIANGKVVLVSGTELR